MIAEGQHSHVQSCRVLRCPVVEAGKERFEAPVNLSLGPVRIVSDNDKYGVLELVRKGLHGLGEVSWFERDHIVHLFILDMIGPPNMNTHKVTIIFRHISSFPPIDSLQILTHNLLQP